MRRNAIERRTHLKWFHLNQGPDDEEWNNQEELSTEREQHTRRPRGGLLGSEEASVAGVRGAESRGGGKGRQGGPRVTLLVWWAR